MIDLKTQLPDLYTNAQALYGDTLIIAILIVAVGFTLKTGQSLFGDPGQMLRALLGVSIVGLMVQLLPDLFNDLQLFSHAFIQRIGAAPDIIHHEFAELILKSDGNSGKEIGFWDVILGLGQDVGLGEAFSYAMVYLASQCAWAISYLYSWLQHILLIYGIAVAPVFLAFFMIDTLKPVAGKYFMGLVSISFWPLGWAIAHVVTKSLLDMSVDSDGTLSSHGFWTILLLTIWMLFATIAAPLLISKMLISGVNAGGELIKGFVSSIGQAITMGATSATTTYMMQKEKGAVSKRLVAGSGAASAGTTFLGRAAGSTNPMPPVIIGVGAGLMGPKPAQNGHQHSQRADEIYKKTQSKT